MRTFEKDSFTLRVPVIDEATGLPFNLTNATAVAYAQRAGGQIITAQTNIVGSEIAVSFVPETFAAAVYQLQVRVTKDAEVQTVLDEEFTVDLSIN